MAKRPDVRDIESGEIEPPTRVKGLKSIGGDAANTSTVSSRGWRVNGRYALET